MISGERLQKVLDLRGYVTVASMIPLPIGQIVDKVNVSEDQGVMELADYKVVIIAETDLNDFNVQLNILGLSFDRRYKEYFYRAVIE